MEHNKRRIILQLRGAISLGWLNGVVAARRNPLWIISNLIPPITFLILMKIYARPEMMEYALIGGFIMIIASNAIGLMGDTVFYKREVKFQDMIVASPMTPVAYMFGLVLSGAFFSIPGITLFLILMAYYHLLSFVAFGVIILSSILSLVALSGLAFTLATFVKEPRFVWPLSGILSFLISVLPPVYYPWILLNKWLAVISMFIPSSSAAALFQKHLGLTSSLPMNELFIWIILIVESLLLLEVAMKLSNWRES
ncbi:ABC transporter permease [Fervidicoccus fontis]|uniref:ABC transporter permease n=1 Tax=Fervidicoccus fontis TaxID=683846 RepID=A0A7C2VF98_9CREN|nr:ABC transporter permease [Fervidicoccus fontis]PMB77307.1 MAG: hypothetical protein C0177_03615 [Fervidicoccus fontis]HEW64207.1 ABC transporter permease [Fervidicoccus fontis]